MSCTCQPSTGTIAPCNVHWPPYVVAAIQSGHDRAREAVAKHLAKTEPSKWHPIAESIASTVAEKNAAYGDSFARSGEIMAILYPDGVSVAQLPDALAVVRVIDKLFRIATDRDALGESPWRDIAGYALLAVEKCAK